VYEVGKLGSGRSGSPLLEGGGIGVSRGREKILDSASWMHGRSYCKRAELAHTVASSFHWEVEERSMNWLARDAFKPAFTNKIRDAQGTLILLLPKVRGMLRK